MLLESAEESILGVTHTALGAYLLDWWNLPQSIIETCLYHHDPLNKAVLNKDICSMIHIADYYSWMNLHGKQTVGYCENAQSYLSIDQATIEEVINEIND